MMTLDDAITVLELTPESDQVPAGLKPQLKEHEELRAVIEEHFRTTHPAVR